jgi:hypothetical protein
MAQDSDGSSRSTLRLLAEGIGWLCRNGLKREETFSRLFNDHIAAPGVGRRRAVKEDPEFIHDSGKSQKIPRHERRLIRICRFHSGAGFPDETWFTAVRS